MLACLKLIIRPSLASGDVVKLLDSLTTLALYWVKIRTEFFVVHLFLRT